MVESNIDYEQFKDSNNTSTRRRSRSKSKNNASKRNFLSFIKVPGFIKDLFSNKNLATKIGVTLLIVFIYRTLSSVPLPGVNMGVYEQYFQNASASEANFFFLVFTGNTLETPSIVGLGIAAYINASIIMQLLTPVIPRLTELSKDGAQGQQVINQITRYLTLPISFVYSVAYLLILSRQDLSGTTGSGDFLVQAAPGSDWPSLAKILFMALVLTAGSMFLMWLAEVITENGIGNGSSIIISTGIIASLPTLISQDFSRLDFGGIITNLLKGNFAILSNPTFIALMSVVLGFIVVIVAIIFINESVRKIKIQYARRAVATPASQDSHLPIKLTITGVLPIIFASALLSVPQLIIPFISSAITDPTTEFARFVYSIRDSFLLASTDSVVNSEDLMYSAVYFVLIVLFGVFYAFIALKPSDTAENLQKQSAFIPGIRPGKSTEEYVTKVLGRIGFAGAIFLGVLALIPQLARNVIQYTTSENLVILSGIGGTSILIIVSVILDTVRQYNALKVTKSYDQYTSV